MLKVIKKLNYRYSLCECHECGNTYKVKHSPSDLNQISHLCSKCSSLSEQVLDQKLVTKFFNYDPVSGLFTHRLPTAKNTVGSVAGYVDDTGYRRIRINNKAYRVHRLIWLYQTGVLPDLVDHIDHDRLNNSWSNLREVDRTGNARNKTKSKANTSGTTGVSYETRRNKWRASIGTDGRKIDLGMFETLEEAVAARKIAEKNLGYHENHGS